MYDSCAGSCTICSCCIHTSHGRSFAGSSCSVCYTEVLTSAAGVFSEAFGAASTQPQQSVTH